MKMSLVVLTPEREVYNDEIELVVTQAANGEVGIMPGHTHFASRLGITTLRVQGHGQELKIAVHNGFLDVTPELVTVLAEVAELPGEIDIERAEQAKARAMERLQDEASDTGRAELALKKALNRLGAK